MKKLLFISVFCATTCLCFCQINAGYQKGEAGLEYKIVRNGNKNLLQIGQYVEMHFTSFLTHNGIDTIITNTRTSTGSQIFSFDSLTIPSNYFSIFKAMNEGDSLTTKTLVDSVFKQSPEQMPNFMKLGDYVGTNVSIVNIYKTKAEADVVIKRNQDKAKEAAALKEKFQVVEDDLAISNYIVSNNIKATKNPSGVYVSIDKEGVGPVLNKKQIVKIMYRGKTLKGLVFDTNMDASKGHEEPLTVNLTDDRSIGNGVITGMTDALLTMKKGTKGSMFIPSGLAYGPRGAGGEIGPNENMIFDVEVLSVQTIEQFKAEQNKLSKPATGKVVDSGKAASEGTKTKMPIKKAPVKTVKKVIRKK